jgi:hypothetical protein
MKKAESQTSFVVSSSSNVSEKYSNLANISTSLASQIDISQFLGLPIGFVDEIKAKPEKEIIPLPIVSKFSVLEGISENFINYFFTFAKITYDDGTYEFKSNLSSLSGNIQKVEFVVLPTRKHTDFSFTINSDTLFDVKFGSLFQGQYKSETISVILFPDIYKVEITKLEDGKNVGNLEISLMGNTDLSALSYNSSIIAGYNIEEKLLFNPIYPLSIKEKINYIIFSLTTNNISEVQGILEYSGEKISYSSSDEHSILTSGNFNEIPVETSNEIELNLDNPQTDIKKLRIIIERNSFLNDEDKTLTIQFLDSEDNPLIPQVSSSENLSFNIQDKKLIINPNSNVFSILLKKFQTPVKKVKISFENRTLKFHMVSLEKSSGIYFIGKGNSRLKVINSPSQGLNKEEVALLKKIPDELKSTLYSLSYLIKTENGYVIRLLNEKRLLISL